MHLGWIILLDPLIFILALALTPIGYAIAIPVFLIGGIVFGIWWIREKIRGR
jgi:hypothetical protein